MSDSGSSDAAVSLIRALAAPPAAVPNLAPFVASVTDAGSWPRVFGLLDRHRLTALAAIRLGGVGGLPRAVVDEFDAERRSAGIHALAAAAELTAALRVLAAAGIVALPFKGPVLALAVYGDLASRRMTDVDLVVSPMDRQRALGVLAAAGWRWPTAGARTRDLLHQWLGHVPLVREGATIGLELHWRFAPEALPWTLPVEDVLARAVPVPSAPDPSWLTPHPSDHLLLLAWHGTRHGWIPLEWLVGFAHVLAAVGRTDAVAAASTARRVGGARALGIAVAAAEQALGVPITPSLEPLTVDPVVRAAATTLVAGMWADAAPAGEQGDRHRYWIRCLDSTGARVRFIALTGLLPTERELEIIRLPEALAALYYPLRIARVVSRALMGRTA